MNGIKAAGVPWGTKWANMCWVWLIHPNNINAIHSGKARLNVIIKWLVLVKIYGNNPKKLLNTIRLNNETNIIVIPECCGPNKVLNSKCRVLVTFDHIRVHREGIAQKSDGINNIPKKVESQFIGRDKIVEVGSNTENKLVIIFKSFLF